MGFVVSQVTVCPLIYKGHERFCRWCGAHLMLLHSEKGYACELCDDPEFISTKN